MYDIIPHTKNPRLREVAHEVSLDNITAPHIKDLIAEMSALLAKEKNGVALAAPQVGEPLRLFIVSGRALAHSARSALDEEHSAPELEGPPPPDEVYINPVLLKMSREKTNKHEGCLSIRGKWGLVPRAEKATLRAYNAEGREFTRGASGFLAHIFQHEMDHLEGILYTDKAVELYDEEPDSKE